VQEGRSKVRQECRRAGGQEAGVQEGRSAGGLDGKRRSAGMQEGRSAGAGMQ
jgi:hypothetical protein